MSVAGLLVRCQGEFALIPATLVRSIRYDVVITPFPGTEIGMAMLKGRIVPVVSMGPPGRALVMCEVDGELIALSGLEPVKSGFFEGDAPGPTEAETLIPTLPIKEKVEASYAALQTQFPPFKEESWTS